MPVLSSTAPVITPEFEQQERAALSDEELQLIDDEMHGRACNLLPESEEMRQSAAALLHEELLGIPDREKLAYLEALERNAEVVDRETDPVAFMRCERYNPGVSTLYMWRVCR
jgi:hypothetical protein